MSAVERTPDREAVLALRGLERALARLEAAQDDTDPLPDEVLASAAAVMQATRKRLSGLEATYADALGKRQGRHVGYLPDGRQYTLERYPDRKAWDHEEWKRDVRRVLTRQATDRWLLTGTEVEGDPVPYIVDTETGEEVTFGEVVQTVLSVAQEAHGSTAPRSTALKALGLWATDYCESTPGGWKFAAVALSEGAS